MIRPFLLALAVAACSSGSSSSASAPSDAASRDARAPLADASPDAHLDARRDTASLPPDSASDISHPAPPDATLDAPPDAPSVPDASIPDPAPPDAPPAPCTGARNVFTLTQSHPGGPLGSLSTTTLTNLDALWSVGTSPLAISATPGSGAVASLSVTLPFGASLTAGTYAQGTARPDGGPLVDLSFAANECQPTAGTFTLANLAADDAGVASVLATFSLACATGPGQTDEVSGCVRYQADTASPDAGVVPPEPGYDAGLGPDAAASPLAPCLGDPQAFYVAGSPLAATAAMITGAEGDWSGANDGVVTLSVDSDTRWSLALGTSDQSSLAPGTTYTGAGNLPSATAPYFSLLANGIDCGSPHASFTVYDYADTGGDEATVTRLAASFSVTCTTGGTTGTVVGCVHYVE